MYIHHPPLRMKFDEPSPPTSSSSSDPWRSRRVMLLGALAVVTLVNVARMAEFQRYFTYDSQDGSSLNDSHALSDDEDNCRILSKSHVDPQFYRYDACHTQQQVVAIIKQLVFTAAEVFTAHNITYFLDSGTLLGAFRDKKVISHDVDADFGIDPAALRILQTQVLDFPEEYFFTVWNSTLYPKSPRDDKLPARLIHKQSGLYLDVFAFLEWDDKDKVGPLPSWCFMNCAGCPKAKTGGKTLRVAKDWIYPLVDCELEGKMVKCPQQTQQYLRYTFGGGYMTPRKYFYSS